MVDKMVSEVIKEFGQIDVLVHCAGIPPHGPVLQMTDAAWHRGINVNLSGVFYVSRAVGRAMVKRKAGTMIFLASDRGLYGGAKVGDYAAAKRQCDCIYEVFGFGTSYGRGDRKCHQSRHH